mgnify:CR=1 FL=1
MKKYVFVLAAILAGVASGVQAQQPPQPDRFGDVLNECMASGALLVDCARAAGSIVESGQVEVKEEFDFTAEDPYETRKSVWRCTLNHDVCNLYFCDEGQESLCFIVAACFYNDDGTLDYCDVF